MDAKRLGGMPASPLPMVSTIDGDIRSAWDNVHTDFHGLTKRELFSAMVMQGLISSEIDGPWPMFAESAVRAADALLAELAKGTE
jgi:hypothetical protein